MGLVKSVSLGGNIYGTDLNFEFALFATRFFRNDLLILGEIQNMVVSLQNLPAFVVFYGLAPGDT